MEGNALSFSYSLRRECGDDEWLNENWRFKEVRIAGHLIYW